VPYIAALLHSTQLLEADKLAVAASGLRLGLCNQHHLQRADRVRKGGRCSRLKLRYRSCKRGIGTTYASAYSLLLTACLWLLAQARAPVDWCLRKRCCAGKRRASVSTVKPSTPTLAMRTRSSPTDTALSQHQEATIQTTSSTVTVS
jgi:hypothetical protein